MISPNDPVLPVRVRAVRSDKSQERIAIEAALQASPEPLNKLQLAVRCNLPTSKVATILSSLCQTGYAHRVPTPGQGAETRFAWGGRPAAASAVPAHAATAQSPTPATFKPRGYDGRELQPFTARAGAMDAFALPTIQNGQRTERRPPSGLGTSVPGKAR